MARVELGYKRPLSTVRTKGREVIAINTTRETGANVLKVMASIRRTIVELYRGLGSVVIDGLLVSTVFTLFLVPTFLSLTMDLRQWLASRMQIVANGPG